MDTPSADPALPIREGDPPRPSTAAGQDDWADHDDMEPHPIPDAWITLLFGLLVTVFTLAAAWNWFRA